MSRLESGFVYLWALFAVALAGIVMAGTGQMWQTKSQREKEMQLMYVGEEFRKAIMSYYNSSGGAKQYPESLEDLLQDSRTPAIKRHLRKIYVDPITNTVEWGIVEESQADNSAASKGKQASSGNQTSNTSGQASNASGQIANSNQASNTGGQASNSNQTLNASGQVSTGNQAPNSSAPSSSVVTSSSINKRIIGVYSLSERKPIKKDQFPEHFAKFSEALTYRDWQFVYKPGDTKKAATPTSTTNNQLKPNAGSTPATGASPFSSQSSPNTSSKGASPFSSQSSSTSNSKAPAAGGFSSNED
jgi:hypothetical protein